MSCTVRTVPRASVSITRDTALPRLPWSPTVQQVGNKAQLYASALCRDERAAQLIIEAAQHEAERILRDNERAFRALVLELQQRRTIDGATFLDLIRRERAKL
jgi:hypothetical protein